MGSGYTPRETLYDEPLFCSHCGSKMVIRERQYGGYSRTDGHKLREAICEQIIPLVDDLTKTHREIWAHDRADENQSGHWEIYRQW